MSYRIYYRQGALKTIWLLLIANFTLFLAAFFYGRLLEIFGLQGIAFLSRPWTLVTSMFLHLGVWHLLTNMLALFFFGRYLSRLVGTRRFLVVYFLGGICAGIFHLLFASPYTIAIGASGAIFALGGTLAIMRPNLKVIIFPIPIPMPLWAAIIGGFLVLSLVPGVAWQAHLGGLLFGLLSGFILRRRERRFF